MKIIEALKQIKDLKRKLSDIEKKISQYCSDLDFETPHYPDQRQKVNEWVQGYCDIIKEIEKLQYRIQKTNILTQVTIVLGENEITKSIAQWIHRRKELSSLEASVWDHLTTKGMKEGKLQTSSGNIIDSKIRLYYDPIIKDKKLEILRSEPSMIDGKLEIINAITDLLD